MVWLKFYQKERQRFLKAFNHKVTDEQARKIIKKLVRHFKIPLVLIDFRGHHGGGHAHSNIISVSHNPAIGVLCHELAHVFNKAKYGNWKHNKKLMRTIGTFIKYCEKKNYWENGK